MTTTITEERIAPIIDAEAEQNAAHADPYAVKMIYDRDIPGTNGKCVCVTTFTGYGSDVHPILLGIRFDSALSNYHLSLDEAIGIRDALTAAVEAWKAVTGHHERPR